MTTTRDLKMSEQGLEHSEQYSSNTAKSKLAQRLNRRSSTAATDNNDDANAAVTDTNALNDALALADAKNRQQLGEETLRLETSIKQQKQHDKVTQKIKVMLSSLSLSSSPSSSSSSFLGTKSS